MIVVDSNVLIDVIGQDQQWRAWSLEALKAAIRSDRICITPIIVAEVGPKFPSLNIFCAEMAALQIDIEPLTDKAAFVAGQAFRVHRKLREGPKSILADFLIGGQAAVAGATILTRDPRFYRTYFPSVPLIAPDND